MKVETVNKLRAAQRKMLRSIVARDGRGQRVPKGHQEKEKNTGGEEEKESEEDDEGAEDEDEQGSAMEDEEDEEEVGEEEELEEWLVWVQRVTRIALKELNKAQVQDWGDAARRSTWTLAGHMARRTDERWSVQILDWWPDGSSRKTGRPLKRWSEDIQRFTATIQGSQGPEDWRLHAQDREAWKQLGDDFTKWADKAKEEKDEEDPKEEEG